MISVATTEQKTQTFNMGGLRWLCDGTFLEMLKSEIIPNLSSLERAGGELIKDTNTRRVWRVKAGGGTYYIKIHKIALVQEKLKYIALPSRAMAEWRISRAFNAKGVPAANAVAVGERRIAGILVDAVLISEEIPYAESLQDILAESQQRRRREVLALAAQVIKDSHDANLLHRDIHGGNILISGDKAFFIDLHRASVDGAISTQDRIRSVAQFLAMLGDKISWGERLHILKKYYGDGNGENFHNFYVDVTYLMHNLREERYKSRSARCVKKSSGFRIERSGWFKVYRRKEFPAKLIAECIKKHHDAPKADVLKQDRRARVTAVDVTVGDKPYRVCVKEFIRRSPLKIIGDALRGSPAMRAWLGSHALAARGIGTPRALALAESAGRSYFITEFINDSLRLNDFVARIQHPTTPDKVRLFRKMVCELADFVKNLHQQSVQHKDLSAKNILVESDERGLIFRLVDTSDIRCESPEFRFKVKNLGQLGQIYALPSRTMRHRFIRRYAGSSYEFLDREIMGEIDKTSSARHENWLRNGGREILEELDRQRSNA